MHCIGGKGRGGGQKGGQRGSKDRKEGGGVERHGVEEVAVVVVP